MVTLLEGEHAAGLGEHLIACNGLDGVHHSRVCLDQEGTLVQGESHVDRAKAFADGNKHGEAPDATCLVSWMDQGNVVAAVVDSKVKGVVLGQRMMHVAHGKEVKFLRRQVVLHAIGLDSHSCAANLLET